LKTKKLSFPESQPRMGIPGSWKTLEMDDLPQNHHYES
jgi:hypothetical protein